MSNSVEENIDCWMMTKAYPTTNYTMKWSIQNFHSLKPSIESNSFSPFEKMTCRLHLGVRPEKSNICFKATYYCEEWDYEVEGHLALYDSSSKVLLGQGRMYRDNAKQRMHKVLAKQSSRENDELFAESEWMYKDLFKTAIGMVNPLPEEVFVVLRMTGRRSGPLTEIVKKH